MSAKERILEAATFAAVVGGVVAAVAVPILICLTLLGLAVRFVLKVAGVL